AINDEDETPPQHARSADAAFARSRKLDGADKVLRAFTQATCLALFDRAGSDAVHAAAPTPLAADPEFVATVLRFRFR
ncbi:MAG: hypothetical protein MI723_08505, partial [Caulobacterales bacterium]|nr:hypothetical protein [Caulobacterales bacterium]